MSVQFHLLGALEVRVDGRPIDLGHVRLRSVLAILLVEANSPVASDQLVERIWGPSPPPRASTTVYSYVSRLRRSLAGVARVELARRAGGYGLSVDPMTVDLHRFRHLVATARAASGTHALTIFDEALALWRGSPFAGLHTPWLSGQRLAAVGERLAAELDRNDLALACGRHAELLAGLQTHSAANPLDERVAAQLMLALYRCGRQADALDQYDRVRKRLADELGTDPGPLLRQAQRQVLTGEPDLAAPVSGPPAVSGRRPGDAAPPTWLTVPRQLPAPPSGFTGRSDQLAELDRAMAPLAERPATVVITAVGGCGGIGKTWLALQWAHENISRFDDGQLYVNLRGFDPAGEPLSPEIAVRGFLEALGVPPTTVPAHLDAQSALYRSLTAGKRMLVVLDNARGSAQVVPLLPGSSTCTVLVTSRHTLSGLVTAHGARPIVVDVLSDAEARQLLTGHLGDQRVASEPGATDALISHCAGLPLALGIVAARARIRTDLSLAELAEQLRDTSTRLDALDAGELAVNLRAVLSCSRDALTTDAAEVFALLGLGPGPDVGLAAAASLVGVPIGRARTLLRELVHAHLVQAIGPDRYRMHDLVRLFAAEHAARSADHAHEATNRLLDHYLYTAHAANAAVAAGRGTKVLPPPRPGGIRESFTDVAGALAWFAAERPALVNAVEHAAAHGFDRHAWQIAWACSTFLNRREHWHDVSAMHLVAVASAQRLADPLARTHAHRGLAGAYIGMRRYDDARDHLVRALEFAVAGGDTLAQAQAHRSLGRLHAKQNRFQEALDHDERALTLFRAAANEVGQANTLNAIGWHLAHLGQHRQAVTRCQQALRLYERLGDRHGQAITWDSLGFARHQLGEYGEAVGCYERTTELLRGLGHGRLEGGALVALGDALQAGGHTREAEAAWRAALLIYEDLVDPAAGAVRERLRRSAT